MTIDEDGKEGYCYFGPADEILCLSEREPLSARGATGASGGAARFKRAAPHISSHAVAHAYSESRSVDARLCG